MDSKRKSCMGGCRRSDGDERARMKMIGGWREGEMQRADRRRRHIEAHLRHFVSVARSSTRGLGALSESPSVQNVSV